MHLLCLAGPPDGVGHPVSLITINLRRATSHGSVQTILPQLGDPRDRGLPVVSIRTRSKASTRAIKRANCSGDLDEFEMPCHSARITRSTC